MRFMLAFLGVILGGGLPVPVPAKGRRRSRMQQIVADCEPYAIVLDEEFAHVWKNDASLPVLTLSELDGPVVSPDNMNLHDPAFIQYTSGSTGNPRGVVVSHNQLASNSNMIAKAFGHDHSTRFAGWVPLFHDMGLVGAALHPLLLKAEAVLMPPEGFLKSPQQWLRMISDYRATTSGAPDFAYRACAAITDMSLLEGIDLSSWRVAYTGAELIRAETLRQFETVMAPFGFDPSAWLPCYGLAETTLLSAGCARQTAPVTMEVNLSELDQSETTKTGTATRTREIVGVGPAVPDSTIRIVKPDSSMELPAGRIGEIWIAGDHVSQRYWNSEQDLRDGHLPSCGDTAFLRTGDLGFLCDGELYVVGRCKNMMIINGRNVYPFDIEVAAGAHASLREARVAAIAISSESFTTCFDVSPNPVLGNELPVLIAEIEPSSSAADRTKIAQDVVELVRDSCDVDLCAIVLVEPGGVEVTTSGKLRHERSAEKLLNHEYRGSLTWLSPLVSDAADSTILRLADAVLEKAPASTLAGLIGHLCARESEAGQEPSPDTPLVEAGLTSLGIMNLSAHLNELTGVDIPVEFLYGGSTLLDLAHYLRNEAERIDSSRSEDVGFSLPEWSPGGDAILQRRVVVGDGAYVLAFSISGPRKIINDICTEALLLPRTFQSLRLRSKSLGAPWHLPDEDNDPPLAKMGSFVDQSSRDDAFRRATLEPFDLSCGPLRLALVSGPEKEGALLVMVHHAAADFWTMAAIVKHLADISRGVTVSRVERQRKKEPTNPAHWTYWKKTFSGLVCPALPRDRVGPGGGEPCSASFAISQDTVRKLKQRTGQTVFVALTTSLCAVIARWSGSWDRVIGVPVAGALDGTAGYSVQIVPVRVTITADQCFSEAVNVVSGQVGDAMANRNVPFEQLRSELHAEVSGVADLFEIAIVHLSASQILPDDFVRLALRNDGSHCQWNSVRFSSANLGPHALELPLEIVVCEIGGKIEGVVRLDSGLFSQNTANELAQRISEFTENAASHPEKGLALLVDSNQEESVSSTSEERRSDLTLHSMLDEQAKLKPVINAFETDSAIVSYSDLARMSDYLAARIIEQDVEVRRIAVRCKSQDQAIIGVFAALKTGALAVPIDPTLPIARQRVILNEFSVDLLLCDEEHIAGDDFRNDMVQMRITKESPGAISRSALLPNVPANAPAYMLFTSGSTGTSKGIIQSHTTFGHFLAWQAEALDIKPGARVAQVAAPGFDVALCEIFGALCYGATLLLPRRQHDLAPDRLLDWLEESRASIVQVTPSLLGAAMRIRDGWPSSLRTVANIGEPLPAALASEILKRGGPALRLINIYGPTETIAASWHQVTQADLSRPSIPVGLPIPGRTLELRDEFGELVPRGIRGEVHIRSKYMSDGYVGPRKHEGFLVRPNESTDGYGIYKTGDIGRFNQEGLLELFGRQDNQVKLNGVRIELEEIELALLRHPSVTAAIAIVDTVPNGPSRLLAAVEALPDTTPANVRCEALQVLPANFVPAIIVVVPRLPRTLNGKINRHEFSARLIELVEEENAKSAAIEEMNDTQKHVAMLWSQIIPEAPTIGSDSNFFACGGHSINAMQLLNQLHTETGVQISLAEFLASPTVSALSEIIANTLEPRDGE